MINAAAAKPSRFATNTQQLTLLPATDVNTRFALSKSTRERGLRHVAEIRQQLALRHAISADTSVSRLPVRHDAAA